jgi:hypothetical protein
MNTNSMFSDFASALPDWQKGDGFELVPADGTNYRTSDDDHAGTRLTDASLFGGSSQQGVQSDGAPDSDKNYPYTNDSPTSDTTYDPTYLPTYGTTYHTGGIQTPVSSNNTSLSGFSHPTLADAGHQTESIAEGAVLNDIYAGASFDRVLNDINHGASFELVGGATTVITEARNGKRSSHAKFASC